MDMTIRQVSDLVDGAVVGEHRYSAPTPADLYAVLQLVFTNCADFMNREDITLSHDTMELEKLTFRYRGMAGSIEVMFATDGES